MLLVSVFVKVNAQNENIKAPQTQQEEIPITILKSGHIIIPTIANDTINGNFIFDTGGGIEVISSKFFDKIKSNSTRVGLFTGFRNNGERLDLKTYRINNLQIGNLIKKDIIVGIYPPLDEMGIDGLLSSKFFESIPVTIDFEKEILTIENKESVNKIGDVGTTIPLFIQMHGRMGLDLFIDITINDVIHVFAEFDTGNGYFSTLINSFYYNLLSNQNLSESNSIVVDKLSLKFADNIKLFNSEIQLKEDLIYEGLIGTNIFKTGKLTIDIQNKRMIFRD